MPCPLCGRGRARRTCPALQQEICAVCCGSKRLIEIQCPSDCAYLALAREHPPAILIRRQQRDVGLLMRAMRDLSERQSQLFLMTGAFVLGYAPSDLHQVVDEDVAEAAGALARTFETAERGVIYEHRASSRPAEGLATAMRPIFEAAPGGGTLARDGIVILRRVEEAVRELHEQEPGNARAFLEILDRVMGKRGAQPDAVPQSEPSRLIVL